jgi:hypothetical protein
MNKKTTLAVLLSVMLVATAFIVWDVAALSAGGMSELSNLPCKYISEPPCPTSGDCGYHWDGTCCIARCQRLGCFTICKANLSISPAFTP